MQKLNRSLLFTESNTVYSSGEDTPIDLKLDMLLPEGTAELFRVRPTEKGLLLRREFFAGILADRENAAARFKKRLAMLDRAEEAYKALEGAVCDNARYCIFFEYAKRMVEIYRVFAEDFGYGELYSGFSSYFADAVRNEDFAELCGKLESVAQADNRIGALNLNADGEKIKVSREIPVSMRERIARCLEAYGISAPDSERKRMLIQKSIIDASATLYPAEFAEFAEFYRVYGDFFDRSVFDTAPEFRLAIGIIDLVGRAEAAGLPYCFPSVSEAKKIKLYDVYDIALLLKGDVTIVPNDGVFTSDEPFFYLTGANGGGKTTYLRAMGNAVLMFLFGAPVFCRGGECCLLDGVHTHFPKDERFEGSGRFADEQKRVETILSACENAEGRGNSLILLNETYSTTNEEKATVCTSELARRLHGSGNFGLYITHQHGVDEAVVPFLGVLVDEQDRNRRTYRIERRRLKNRSFAADILAKYGITAEGLGTLLRGNG